MVDSDSEARRTSSRQPLLDRRSTLSVLGGTAAFLNAPGGIGKGTAASAAELVAPTELKNGLLNSRVTENLMSPPPYGLECADINYPSYFAGVWSATSEAKSVFAPCGVAVFGGNATLRAAENEIGPDKALRYRARFVPGGASPASSSSTTIVADREFNVREIAKASMGSNAVVDVSLVTPNKFSCVLAPSGAGKLFNVDLIALARRAEDHHANSDDPYHEFDCSEVVRQIIAPLNSSGGGEQRSGGGGAREQPQPSSGGGGPVLKEIETISLYTAVPGANGEISEIKCQQRSATFLLPSQTDLLAYKMWEYAKGRPIDVRFYDVTYSKI